MPPETRKTLLNLISEYGDSLTRMDSERDLLKAIEDRAENECAMPAKAFRTAATAYHRDQVDKKREELTEQIDAFELIQGEPA
jgi:hypothetical protein